MNDVGLKLDIQSIEVDEIFPHAPETIWKALTSGDLIGRWLMEPQGFAPVVGNHFTFQTTPAGAWDGAIRCEVLEVVPHRRFVFAWKGGDDGNIGYGSRLDTVVTWSLSPVENGTRFRVVHSGFELPRNETAFRNMGDGWKKIAGRVGALAAEQEGKKNV
jgi:uncharacterized protein YndB with AHSA1/START domain